MNNWPSSIRLCSDNFTRFTTPQFSNRQNFTKKDKIRVTMAPTLFRSTYVFAFLMIYPLLTPASSFFRLHTLWEPCLGGGGGCCPSDVCSILIIRPSSFQIKSVSALEWKRPVFQSWAYGCLACAHRGFSFSRRVTNTAFEGHWNPLFNPISSFQTEEILL